MAQRKPGLPREGADGPWGDGGAEHSPAGAMGQRLCPNSTVHPRPGQESARRGKEEMEGSLLTGKLLIFLCISPVLVLNIQGKLVGPRTEGGKVTEEKQSLTFQQ